MHTTPSEALTWLGAFLAALEKIPHQHAEIALAVPATHVATLAARAKGGPLKLAGQDLSQHDEGAYTGEVSGAMLRDAGASYVVVGHSERRAYHGEDDALAAAKVRAARRHQLVPVLCVGEREEDRDAGRAEDVVLEQLNRALEGFAVDDPGALVVAYEPVWAIGTGRTATADDAQAMCAAVRGALRDRYRSLADGLRVLYGGSMKPVNAGELLAKPDVDGGLVGGASLVVDDLLAIVEAAA